MRLILFSDKFEIYKRIMRVISDAYHVEWYKYNSLDDNFYTAADIVLMHFIVSKDKIEKAYEYIIKVRSRLGSDIPILALMEGENTQDIFSVLNAGAFDYLTTLEDEKKIKKKISDIERWIWYRHKYCS